MPLLGKCIPINLGIRTLHFRAKIAMGRGIFELFQELLVFFLGQLYLANLMVYLMKLLNYSHLSNNRGGWNKRGGSAKVAKSINVEVGINVEGDIFLKGGKI